MPRKRLSYKAIGIILLPLVLFAWLFIERNSWRPQILPGHRQSITALAFSPDGRFIVAGGGEPVSPQQFHFSVWDVKQRVLVHQQSDFTIDGFAFAPDGKELAAIVGNGIDYGLYCWQAPSGDWSKTGKAQPWEAVPHLSQEQIEKRQMEDSEALQTGEKRLEWLIGYQVSACAYSPDGKTLAVASLQSLTSVSLWDVQTHKLIRRLPAEMTNTFCVAFSPDGKTLAAGTTWHYGDVVVLWDWRTGKRLRSLRRHAGTIRSVAFSPDGKLIASGGDDNVVKLWNAQNGALVRALPLKSDYCGKVAFSPDGKTVAASGEVVYLWDVTTGKVKRTLPGSQSLAFSPDGRTLATEDKGHVNLWRVK